MRNDEEERFNELEEEQYEAEAETERRAGGDRIGGAGDGRRAGDRRPSAKAPPTPALM